MNSFSNNKQIAILLSTYNGDKFLRSHLDSLVNQSVKNFNVFIRDDGSIDGTREIVEVYCKKYSNFYQIPSTNNVGAAESFLYLLKMVESDYYMFADQDDIWLRNKVRNAYRFIKEVESQFLLLPTLIFTDAFVTDSKLNVLQNSFLRVSGICTDFITSKGYVYVTNVAPGCTYIFNKSLRDISLCPVAMVPMHDWWLLLNAYKYGNLNFLNTADILYRQHEKNVIGVQYRSSLQFMSKLLNFRETIGNQISQYQFLKQNHFVNNLAEFFFYKLKFNMKFMLR